MVLSHIILSLLILKELLDKWENSLITKERKPVLLHIMLSLIIRVLLHIMLSLPIRSSYTNWKKCNLTLAVSPTCSQHKPSAYLLATFSIKSNLETLLSDSYLKNFLSYELLSSPAGKVTDWQTDRRTESDV